MIVITGASDGLGKQLAKLYAEAGKTVVNISRRICEYADYNVEVNLREGKEIEKAADAVLTIDEPLEAIINCAAVYSRQSVGKITEDEIKRVMSTNVKSAVLLVSNLHERILKDGTDIVNVSSTAGLKGNAGEAVYGASKWAIRGFTASLQTELKDTASRVISVVPGGMKTGLFDKTDGVDDPTTKGEWMDPADVALYIKQTLDLPKNIEVSELILNRKQAK